MDMETFVAELKTGLSDSFGPLGELSLATADWDAVHRLAEEKYRSWEWTYGRSPDFTVNHHIQIDSVEVEAHVHIKNAVIIGIEIPDRQPDLILNQINLTDLIGKRYNPAHPNLK